MEITRTSAMSGITRTRDLPITAEQWAAYESGAHIQRALSHLSDGDREFILTGSTDEEWDDEFSPDSPTLLADLKALAEDVLGADLYETTEVRRGWLSNSAAGDLAQAILRWLDADRPADVTASLLSGAQDVWAREWATVWSDPGDYPSNAGGSALPDEITADGRPHALAETLTELLDRMGLPDELVDEDEAAF